MCIRDSFDYMKKSDQTKLEKFGWKVDQLPGEWIVRGRWASAVGGAEALACRLYGREMLSLPRVGCGPRVPTRKCNRRGVILPAQSGGARRSRIRRI